MAASEGAPRERRGIRRCRGEYRESMDGAGGSTIGQYRGAAGTSLK